MGMAGLTGFRLDRMRPVSQTSVPRHLDREIAQQLEVRILQPTFRGYS